ncbi:MAG: hypothetical protein A2V84_09700 [Chloroflexi bacterium RBG_16_70_13]|nr:MAG: hypothetical protein A2V84_09700 [Chloroflexi bacterium RBG_16_70_13]
MRIATAAGIVCVTSWLALAVGAGNIGLQRSVAVGPLTLLEQPLTVVLVAAVSLGTALAVGWALRVSPLQLLAGVLVGDVAGAVILAPVAIGELEPIHAPVVFAAIAVLGIQPAAAWLGAAIGWAIAGRSGRIPASG